MQHFTMSSLLARDKVGIVSSSVVLFLMLSWPPCATAAELIPADRLADWRPGVTVGVPGGIPTDRNHLIDVTKAPYRADNSGKADAQPAILQAITDAKDDDVVYLPAGVYRCNRPVTVYGGKSRITIRGDGPEKTIIRPSGPMSGGLGVTPGDGGDWWYGNRTKLDITGSYRRGATELTVADAKALDDYPKAGVGQLVQIAIKGDKKLPVLSSGGVPGYDRKYITRIVAKTAATVTIRPPLLFDLPAELAPVMRPVGRYAEFVGIEDLAVDGTDCPSGNCLVSIGQSFGCWVKNVTVRQAQNRLVGLDGALACEIRHCNIAGRKTAAGPNGGGLFLAMASHCLIEDNIISPDTEVDGGAAGNVFAYNFCDDAWVQGGLLGMSIDANHAPHNSFNLYEGNYMPRFQADGYWGSCSHDTAFRNWFHASSEKTTQWWVAVNLNRFTRSYNIVGNVLGTKGYPWLYEVEITGFDYGKHYIYSFGFPNMGNGWCNGKTAQPSKGRYWADWDPVVGTTIKGTLTERKSDSEGKITLSSGMVIAGQAPMLKAGEATTFIQVVKVDGKVATVTSAPWQTRLPALDTAVLLFAGSGGFQELDLDVKATTILKGNYNYKDHGVPAGESLGGATLPDSLYLKAKPSWFGALAWPPFGPDTDFEHNKIPAQVRYERMSKSALREAGAGGATKGPPKELAVDLGGGVKMEMVLVPAGEFEMGSGESAENAAAFFNKMYGEHFMEADFFKDEHPRHHVRITKPFYLGAYHVTRGQFRRFVADTAYKTDAEKGARPGAFGWNPDKRELGFNEKLSWRNAGFEQTDEHPVVNVSWNDAVAFCRWLSKKEGKTYRLPTEAEWEYACRAGTTTRYYSGDDPETLARVGNVADAAAKAEFPDWKYTIKANDGYVFTAPVGKFKPNAYGLYDMHGNAWQWCADRYGAEYYGKSPVDDPVGPDSGAVRVLRGGSWLNWPYFIGSAKRRRGAPDDRNGNTGFRVARSQ